MSRLPSPTSTSEAEQFRELQHFVELGRLSASLLHEIANPLTAALLNLEQASNQATPEVRQARRSLQQLWRYVESARQQVRGQGQVTSFCVNPQVTQLKRLLTPLAKARGVGLQFESLPHCRLSGDPVKFQQALANLIMNAIDAYDDSLTPSSRRPIRVQLTASSRLLTLTVTDWGKGIAPRQLPLLFEPFYTTKQNTRYGLGIGLFLVRQYVVVDFGGSIKVSSSPQTGTQFILKIPLKNQRLT